MGRGAPPEVALGANSEAKAGTSQEDSHPVRATPGFAQNGERPEHVND